MRRDVETGKDGKDLFFPVDGFHDIIRKFEQSSLVSGMK